MSARNGPSSRSKTSSSVARYNKLETANSAYHHSWIGQEPSRKIEKISYGRFDYQTMGPKGSWGKDGLVMIEPNEKLEIQMYICNGAEYFLTMWLETKDFMYKPNGEPLYPREDFSVPTDNDSVQVSHVYIYSVVHRGCLKKVVELSMTFKGKTERFKLLQENARMNTDQYNWKSAAFSVTKKRGSMFNHDRVHLKCGRFLKDDIPHPDTPEDVPTKETSPLIPKGKPLYELHDVLFLDDAKESSKRVKRRLLSSDHKNREQ